MSRNGSGVFTLSAGNPVVSGTPIQSAGWANPTLTDIASEITNSIARDGQSPPTANLPMGGFRHTGASDGVLATDYATVGQLGSAAYAGLVKLGADFVASTDATIDITSRIVVATYSDYLITLNAVMPVTDNVELWLRASGDNGGSWNTSASYAHVRKTINTVGGDALNYASGATQIVLADGLGNAAARGVWGDIRIAVDGNALHVGYHLRYISNGGNLVGSVGEGYISLATNAVQISMSAGDIASGTFRIYALRKT